MKELMTFLTTLIEKSTSSLKVVSNHNNKIEIVPNMNYTALRSAIIDLRDRIITTRFTMNSSQYPLESPILIRFSKSRPHVMYKDPHVITSIQETLGAIQLEIIERELLQSIIIDFKNRNEIRSHFRFQDFPLDQATWKEFFSFLEGWTNLLDKILQNEDKNPRMVFKAPNDPKTLLNEHATLAPTLTTLSRENPRKPSAVPEILRLVAARAESYTIHSRSFQMKPITGAFHIISWSWSRVITKESCQKPVDVTATGKLRNIDDSPPYEIVIQLEQDGNITISGTSDHVVKELYEKRENLQKISSLHHFGGKIHVRKHENRVITLQMSHGTCQHDVEIAYGVIQDIGWTLEMAYYSDRLLTMK